MYVAFLSYKSKVLPWFFWKDVTKRGGYLGSTYLASLWYLRRNWPNHSPSIIRRALRSTHLSFNCPAAKFPSYFIRDAFSTFNRDSPLFIRPCYIRIFAYSTPQLPSISVFLSSSSFPFPSISYSRRFSAAESLDLLHRIAIRTRRTVGDVGRFWSGLRKPLRRSRPAVSSILHLAVVFIGFVST